VSEEADEWRWADAEGAVSSVDTWELTSSLSTGSLPSYTLVWRRGWAEWLPACQVAELAAAVPSGQAEAPVEPKRGALDEPPPPPVDKYRAYKPRGGKLKARGPSATSPPPPRGERRVRGQRATPPPPAPARPPMPTLVETRPPSTITLRPPGAVPPPPRAVPSRTATEEPELKLPPSLATPIPSIAIHELEADTQRDTDLMTESQPTAAQVKEALSQTLQSADAASVENEAPDRPPAAPASRMTIAVVALATIGVALTAAILVVVIRQRTKPQIVVSAAPAGGRAPSGQCLLTHPAERLAPSIVISIPPLVAAVPKSRKLAVGLAESAESALGITIDPQSLAVERVFSRRATHSLTGVVPLTHGAKLGFAVDDSGASLSDARTLDTQPPVTLGITDAGFARTVSGGAPEVIWPGVSRERVTDVRVATAASGDHAVTFRQGGQSGKVMVGWVGPHGEKKSELQAVEPQGHYVGTPVVGANDRAILVAFAARSEKDAYWGVQIVASALGSLPQRSQAFPIPPGGPGIETMSPAVVGMPGGRWMLQWTEGSRGEHVVRVQVLGADLNPIGDAVTVSAKDANAGQGVIWVHGKNALSLYLVSTRKGHELWGAALKCP
jgi:GYF domain 2